MKLSYNDVNTHKADALQALLRYHSRSKAQLFNVRVILLNVYHFCKTKLTCSHVPRHVLGHHV